MWHHSPYPIRTAYLSSRARHGRQVPGAEQDEREPGTSREGRPRQAPLRP